MPGAAGVDAGVVDLVEMMPEGGESGGKTATGIGSGSGAVGGSVVETALLAFLESSLGGSWVANEDLWEVEAVGSPRVRAMT